MRDERARDRHALLLAAGELVRKALAEAGQPHVLQRFRDLAGDLGRRRLRHLERERDVALDGHVREQRVALEDRAHGPRFGRPVGQVFAVQEDAAAVGKVEAGDHPQQRGLAAAGRAQQREELAGLDGQA